MHLNELVDEIEPGKLFKFRAKKSAIVSADTLSKKSDILIRNEPGKTD